MVTQSSIHCKKGVRIKKISEGRLIAFLAPCSETQYYHNTVAGRNRQSRKMKPSMEEDIVQFPRDKQMAFELATLCFLVLRWRYVSQMCLRGSCVIFFFKDETKLLSNIYDCQETIINSISLQVELWNRFQNKVNHGICASLIIKPM